MLNLLRMLLLGIGAVYLVVRCGHFLRALAHAYRLSAHAGTPEGDPSRLDLQSRAYRRDAAASAREYTTMSSGRSSR